MGYPPRRRGLQKFIWACIGGALAAGLVQESIASCDVLQPDKRRSKAIETIIDDYRQVEKEMASAVQGYLRRINRNGKHPPKANEKETRMMTTRKILERIFGHEGGYTQDPSDPGNWTEGVPGHGALKGTKYGISAASYPDLDIRNLMMREAIAIYHRDFIGPISNYPIGDLTMFQLVDFAINSGSSRATKALQKCVGVIPDGIVGPITEKAIRRFEDIELALLIIAERLNFLTNLRNWPDHGKGWARRIASNIKYLEADYIRSNQIIDSSTEI
jgi:lysozyme family protein